MGGLNTVVYNATDDGSKLTLSDGKHNTDIISDFNAGKIVFIRSQGLNTRVRCFRMVDNYKANYISYDTATAAYIYNVDLGGSSGVTFNMTAKKITLS